MYVRFSAAEQDEVWDRYEAGEYMRPIARAIGRSQGAVRDLIAKTGGVRPLAPTQWSDARLSLTEREEISRGIASGESARQIAARLGRAASSISREIKANGGRGAYRACEAETTARLGARRPKVAKLAACPRLRRVVQGRLEKRWSPQQIADWLPRAFPDDPEMRVSHETIYMSLFVQGRGALRQELFSQPPPGASHAPAPWQAGTHGQGDPQRHGHDLEAPAGGGGPGRARALGGRPHHGKEDARYRDPRRALHSLRDALPSPRGQRGTGGAQGPDQAHHHPSDRAAPVTYLGPRTRDGRARALHR